MIRINDYFKSITLNIFMIIINRKKGMALLSGNYLLSYISQNNWT